MMILMLLAAAATLHPHQVALNDCMARNATELATGNTLEAESVIRAAGARCSAEWTKAEDVWRGNRVVMGALHRAGVASSGPRDGGEQADRDAAYLAAFEAVARVRK